jgi:hypothetical protein
MVAIGQTNESLIYEYVPGEIIVQTKDITKLRQFINNQTNISSRAKNFKIPKVAIEEITSSSFQLAVIKTDETEVDGLMTKIRNNETTVHVQRNKIIKLREKPNDPEFIKQWTLDNPIEGVDHKVLKAWDITTGGVTALGDTIVVAIIDDGVGRHDDLVDNLWVNHQEIPGDGIDNDKNGYIDDYFGWNSENKNDNIFTEERHGTSIAGIIGAKGNNGKGVTGINWNVKLMIIDMGNITEANALKAYAYVYDMRKLYNESAGKKGAFIVVTNSSWGIDFGKAKDAPIWCDFYNKLGEIGILNCVASVNKNIDIDVLGDLPTTCESDYIVGVTNLNRFNVLNSDASFGKKSIDLGAYGQRALTTSRNNTYAEFVGTSSATPHVVGAIALAYSVACPEMIKLSKNDPALAAKWMKHILLSSVSPNDVLNNKSTSRGTLDIGTFVTKTQELCGNCPLFYVENDEVTNREGIEKFKFYKEGGTIDLRIRKTEDSIWTVYNNFKEIDSINNLSLCEEIEYQIRHRCNQIAIDSFGYSRYINTYGCCTNVTNLDVKFDTDKIIIKSELTDLVDFTKFEYRKKDDTNWQNIDIIDQNSIKAITNCTLFEYRAFNSCLNNRTRSDTTAINFISTDCGVCTSPTYCTPSSISNRQEWINDVTINENQWKTGQGSKGFEPILSYNIPTFKLGIKYPIKINLGFSGTPFRERFYVYFDTNQDGLFKQDELILVSKDRASSLSDTIIFPPTAKEGISRLRIIMSFAEISSPCTWPELFGEVEDYCINIDRSTNNPSIENNSFSSINTIVTDNLYLRNIPEFQNASHQYSIFNSHGQLIVKGNIKDNLIDCSHLSNSIYFIKIEGNNLIQSFKFIKI